jgi:hypothetical protein
VKSPGVVAFIIPPEATLVIHGREIAARGAPVEMRVAASKTRPELTRTIKPGQPGDLMAMRRAAFERTQPAFPSEKMCCEELKAGTLVIDGGGIPKDALTRFIAAAGGPDALILAVPTAQGDGPPLSSLRPRDQFLTYYRSFHAAEPDPVLMAAFDELAEEEVGA